MNFPVRTLTNQEPRTFPAAVPMIPRQYELVYANVVSLRVLLYSKFISKCIFRTINIHGIV